MRQVVLFLAHVFGFVMQAIAADNSVAIVSMSDAINKTSVGSGTLSVDASFEGGDSRGSWSGSGFARAQTGILKTAGEVSSGSNSHSAIIVGRAASQDAVSVLAPEFEGKLVMVRARIVVFGSVDRELIAEARATWDFSVSGTYVPTYVATGFITAQSTGTFAGVSLGGVWQGPSAPFGGFDLVFPLMVGPSANIFRLSLEGSAAALGDPVGSAGFYLGNSMYWGGVQSVEFEGQALSNYQIASDTHDWTLDLAPVPEPSAAALMLLGLAIAARRGRKFSTG